MNPHEISFTMSPREASFVKHLQREIPNFIILRKDQSRFHKIVAILFKFFCPNYLTHYTTTIYPRVYLPSKLLLPENSNTRFRALAHEWVHLYDRRQEGPLFNFRYLFPQSLLLLFWSIALCVVFWPIAFWVFIGLGVACLLPWPAPFRLSYELRGYLMSWALDAWETKQVDWGVKDQIVTQLTGWAYYKTCWNKTKVMRRLVVAEKWIEGLMRIEGFEGRPTYPYAVVKAFVDKFPRGVNHGR